MEAGGASSRLKISWSRPEWIGAIGQMVPPNQQNLGRHIASASRFRLTPIRSDGTEAARLAGCAALFGNDIAQLVDGQPLEGIDASPPVADHGDLFHGYGIDGDHLDEAAIGCELE